MAIKQKIIAEVDRRQVDALQKTLNSLKKIDIEANIGKRTRASVNNFAVAKAQQIQLNKLYEEGEKYRSKAAAKTRSSSTKTALQDEKKLIDESNAYRLKAAKTTDAKLWQIYNNEADKYEDKYFKLASSRMKSGVEYKFGDAASIRKYYQQQSKATAQAIKEYNASVDAKITKQANTQQYKDIVAQQKSINALYKTRAKYSKGTSLYEQYDAEIKSRKASYDDMVKAYGGLDKFQQSQIDSLVKQNKLQVQDLKLKKQAANYIEDADARYAKLTLEGDIAANSRMKNTYRAQISDLTARMDDAVKANDKEAIIAVQKDWRNLRKEAENSGKAGMTMLDKLKNGFKNFGAYISSAAILGATKRVADAMLQNVRNIDTAMTELRKVTDNSEREYREYQQGVRQTAFDIGSTQTNLISSTATFARLGYNLSESAKLGRNAALYASVGDEGMSADDAATYMVSIMKGFQIAADNSLHIVDALNEVGNNFAISSTGLGESLKRSGGALATGQNTFEEAIGLTVAANDATQDATATGTALKTISLRIRGMRTELQEAGEDTEGMATSTAKLRDDLIALAGVDILEEGGQKFKSTFQIMRELANNWENISDMSQAAIIEEVAGKRGASYFSSAMKNWQDAEAAYQTALNSEGSAEKENENILSSIEGRITRFKAVFESLSTDVIDTDLVKNTISGATGALKLLDDLLNNPILNATGTPGLVGGGIGLSVLLKGVGKEFSDTMFSVRATGTDTATALSKAFVSSFKKIGSNAKEAGAEMLSIAKAHPLLVGVGAAAAVAAAAFAAWDKATDTYSETQQKLSSELTNFNSAQQQAVSIQKEIEENEKSITELRNAGITTMDERAQLETLQRQNTQLQVKKEYEESLAKTAQENAEVQALLALNNQRAYTTSGEKADNGFFGKIGLFFSDIYDSYVRGQMASASGVYSMSDVQNAAPSNMFYDDATTRFNKAIDEYKDARAALESDNLSPQAYTEANTRFTEASSTLAELMADYQEFSTALSEGTSEEAKKFYESVRDALNKANIAVTNEDSFINSLLSRYDDVGSTLNMLAVTGEISTAKVSEMFPEFVQEAEAAGVSVDYIVTAFKELANGGTSAIDLTSDNLETVNSQISEIATAISTVSEQAKLGFVGTGLTNEAYTALGSSYANAMMFTGNGIRLNFSEYQRSRSAYSNRMKADYTSQIETERGLLAGYKKQIEAINKLERTSSNSKYVSLMDKIAGSTENIKRLEVARAQINGLTSDIAQYLEVMDGAYSSTATVDSIAGGFADLEKAFNEGRTSSAQVREFIELWTGQDLSKVSNADIADYWERATEAFKKFNEASEDENGDQTYKYNGEKVMQFLRETGEALNKGFVDADGNISLTSSDLLTLAKTAGISQSEMEELVLALSDFGHDVNIRTTSKSLDQFTDKAEQAASALKKYNVENENNVKEIQRAREEADKANDGASIDDLNNAMVLALKRREEASRGLYTTSLMGADTSKLVGDTKELTQLTQALVEAQERLTAARLAENLGIDIDVDSEIGNLEAAYSKIAEYFSSTGVDLGAIGIDKDATIEEITQQLGEIDINKLVNFVLMIGINKSKFDAGISEAERRANALANGRYNVKVNIGVNGLDHLTAAKAAIQGMSDKQVTVTTVHNDIRSVASGVVGHYTEANGTAHANGYWGAKGGRSLVGELGTELYVDPRTSTWHTVGEHGAEFRNIPRGAIVFNHKQTAEIFKNGRVTSGGGRGHFAYASGTYDNNYSSDVDFAAMRLARLQNTLDDYAALIEFYETFKVQNGYANKSIASAKGLIGTNLSAASAYMAKANSLGLSSSYINQIKNGSLNIETVADDDLRQKIQDYQQYYEAAEACKDAVADLNNQIKELSRQKFDNIVDDADTLLAYEDSFNAYMNAVAELNKERNGVASYSDYSGQYLHTNRSINYLEQYISDLGAELDAQVASGEIKKHSQAWHEYITKINEAKTALAEHRLELEELNNSIRELNWTPFNQAIEKLQRTQRELSATYDLVSDLTAFKDSPTINQNGITQLAILASSLKNARQEIADQQKAYAALRTELNKGIISQTEYDEAVAEVNDSVNSAVSQAKSYRDAIISLVKDGINKETEAFEKLIDARKKNLAKQKEADDYAKTVSDKTKEINSIQAQITALSGDNTLATRSKIRTLQANLAAAEEDLAETRKDHEYDTLTEAYDEQLEQFKETQDEKIVELESSLDAQTKAISTALTVAENNYTEVYNELMKVADIYGVTLNSAVVDPWKSAESAVSEYQAAVNKASSSLGVVTNNYLSADSSKNPAGSFARNVLNSGSTTSSSSSSSLRYKTTGDYWLRSDAGTDKTGLYVIPNGTTLTSDGQVKSWGGYDWYHVNYGGTWGWTSSYGLQKLAKGTKSARRGLALTDERGVGSEAILTKSGVLRQLDAGDMVFSAAQRENLWRLSKIPSMLTTGVSTTFGNGGFKQEVNMNYGSLLTVNGDVSKDTLPDLQTLLAMSSEKTRKDMYEVLRKIGINR